MRQSAQCSSRLYFIARVARMGTHAPTTAACDEGHGQQPVWIMIALVLDAVIAVTGIFVGPGFNMTGLLAVGPLLACARCNGRMTALVAGYALVLCGVVAGVTGTAGITMEWYRIAMVAVAGALAVLGAGIRG